MIAAERDSITTFSTGCPIIDRTLNGGIRLGQITELYGESGCGKTQLCVQMALEVQRTFRARGQEASKGAFRWSRLPRTLNRGCLHQHRIPSREN